MSRKKKNKIVFVCTGNTCRSPMAEIVFKRVVESLKLTGLEILSAGIRANEGDCINPKSRQVLENKGFEVGTFAAKNITDDMLKYSVAIVCMTDSQRDLLMEMRWNVLRKAGVENIENNVYSFSELTGYEVLDPFGRDMDCYGYVFELIYGGMGALTEKILTPSVRKKFVEKPPKTGTSSTRKAVKSTNKKPSSAKKSGTKTTKGKNTGKTVKNKKADLAAKGEKL